MLREYEKQHFGCMHSENPIRYARCVLWASDPEVLKKFLIQDGKFTLDKLLQPSTYAPENFKNESLSFSNSYIPMLSKEIKLGNPVLYSEIIDDHTILLLLDRPSHILPRLFGQLLQESPEYDVIFVPIPINLIWDYQAEHRAEHTNDPQKFVSRDCKCRALFSFEDSSVQYGGDHEKFRQLYDKVMQY